MEIVSAFVVLGMFVIAILTALIDEYGFAWTGMCLSIVGIVLWSLVIVMKFISDSGVVS